LHPSDPLSEDRRLDRRTVLAGVGASVAAYLLGLPVLASAANRVPVWRLDAVHSAGPGAYSPGCTGCHACRNHALNRVFASKEAAAKGRAHDGCNCKVVRGSISATDYTAIFGSVDSPTSSVYDRRWALKKGSKKAKLVRSDIRVKQAKPRVTTLAARAKKRKAK
jgi:hypothetical protein